MPAKVSVVVVSRERPEDLTNLIEALKLQHGCAFELIVVTDAPREIVETVLSGRGATYVHADIANISVMRNFGVDAAEGEIVAFVDDDAVPEPGWLECLVSIFEDPHVHAATGPVLTRDGLSVHYGPTWSDLEGIDILNDVVPAEPITEPFAEKRFLRVQGTNCAFRKQTVIDLGKFDPGFAYYLDETEFSFRLSRAGFSTVFVPGAVVQHLSKPNASRDGFAPKSYETIAKSISHFALKHSENPKNTAQRHFDILHERAMKAFQIGRLEPRNLVKLRNHLRYSEAPDTTPKIEANKTKLNVGPFSTGDVRRSVVIVSGPFAQRVARGLAQQKTAQGHVVTLVQISLSFRRYRAGFEYGYFTLSGGIWRRRGVNGQTKPLRFKKIVRSILIKLRKSRRIDEVHLSGFFSKRLKLRNLTSFN